MKLMTWRDATATLLTGVIVAVYVAFLNGTSLLLISSGRGATAAVLVLGIGAWALRPLNRGTGYRTAQDFAGAATMISNIALLVAVIGLLTGSTVALTILVVSTVALWLITTIRRASGDSLPSITSLSSNRPSNRRRPAALPKATAPDGQPRSVLEVSRNAASQRQTRPAETDLPVE